jgi:glucose/arabinose dehydrogenase
MSRFLLTLTIALIANANNVNAADSTSETVLTQMLPLDLPVKMAEINLPHGFTATQIATQLGHARHLVVRENGDIYVNLQSLSAKGGGIVALRDNDGDYVADEIVHFGSVSGTGIAIFQNYLYASSDTAIYRFAFKNNELLPSTKRETVVSGFPIQNSHASKSFAIDDQGVLYVNVGAPSNACQIRTRTQGSPGQRPCPQLENSGGIWRFSASQLQQQFPNDGERIATGVRHAVALAWDSGSRHLYAAIHGRDQLDTLWPAHFDAKANADLPAEELHRIVEGGDYGWPYTYYDPLQMARVVAPEYGGDGYKQPDETHYHSPLVAFPAHLAPNALLFYHGENFPEKYRGGAFIAFHGSWNRSPYTQAGFNVVFVPFEQGKPVLGWSPFATGFAGETLPKSPSHARYRPTGLAVGADGALFVADSRNGTIWRIAFAPQESDTKID